MTESNSSLSLRIFAVQESNKIVNELNALSESEVWITGASGRTASCQPNKPMAQSIEDVLEHLYALDAGSH